MQPGPIFIIACPQCGALAAVESLLSGNNRGAIRWTDGHIHAPMLPTLPAVTRCRYCAAFFWRKDARAVGKIVPGVKQDVPKDWCNAPNIRRLSEAEYREAIAAGMASDPQKERMLRTWAWWAGNDRFRYPPRRGWLGRKVATSKTGPTPSTEEIFSPEGRVNLERLIALLDDASPGDRLMKAEALRELGRFDEAIALLSEPFSKEHEFAARLIMDLAQQGVSVVHKFPELAR